MVTRSQYFVPDFQSNSKRARNDRIGCEYSTSSAVLPICCYGLQSYVSLHVSKFRDEM
jgi:hypothetical protein